MAKSVFTNKNVMAEDLRNDSGNSDNALSNGIPSDWNNEARARIGNESIVEH